MSVVRFRLKFGYALAGEAFSEEGFWESQGLRGEVPGGSIVDLEERPPLPAGGSLRVAVGKGDLVLMELELVVLGSAPPKLELAERLWVVRGLWGGHANGSRVALVFDDVGRCWRCWR